MHCFCHPLDSETICCHPLILETRTLTWPDEAACAHTAVLMARTLSQPQALTQGLVDARIELLGPLGAGKTTFVRHLLQALGVTGRIKSPTYTVMEAYALPGGLGEAAHFDFYRFNDPREWLDAGFRDVFARPVLSLCEWPDKAAGQLPLADLRLQIEPLDESARQVMLSAHTRRGTAWLQAGWP